MTGEESTDRAYRFEAFAATFLVIEFTADLLMWVVYSSEGIRDAGSEVSAGEVLRHYFIATFGQFDPIYSLLGYEWGIASLWSYLPAILIGLAFARWRGYI